MIMCTSTTCENRATCKRSPDSGSKPLEGKQQEWRDFNPTNCPAYWLVDMDVIRERRGNDYRN